MRFTVKDPGCGYVGNNLLLPKTGINTIAVKATLTFVLEEEEPVIDEETQQLLTTKRRVLELWDETTHHMIVPREYMPRSSYKDFGFPIIDESPACFEAVDIEDHITLKPEQEGPYQALLATPCGTLNLKCGGGKTVIALKLIATLKVPALIVVNTTALLEQWIGEIRKHLDVKNIGIIQGTMANWEKPPVVVAMLHTLAQHKDLHTREFGARFGVVFYDEGHHMSAPNFVQAAPLTYGRRYSLTATSERTDGHEAIYQYHLGRVVYRDLSQELKPHTYFHKLTWKMPQEDKWDICDRTGDVNMSKVRTYLGRLHWRNKYITELIDEDVKSGRIVLVLSHSIDHVRELHAMCKWQGKGLIIGSTHQSVRMKILKESNPLFGTFQLAREGLDKQTLDTLYIVTPFKNHNDLQQAWGRTQRECKGKKEPIVRVVEDMYIGLCIGSCNSLRKYLLAMGLKHSTNKYEVPTDG